MLVGSFALGALSASAETLIGTDLNSATSTDANIAAIYSANRGSNGGGDQSQQFGDSLIGGSEDDILIGGLGIDVLIGADGDDVLIGGTEDFNPLNRDRAFGDAGDDSFIWAPGDGNDFFDGGTGTDVVFFTLVGESADAAGSTTGAPFFGVSPPGSAGAGNFDGIEIVGDNTVLNISGGPGFCEIIEADATNQAGLAELGLDHLVRFVLRGPRANFDAAVIADPTVDQSTLDTGLRVAVHLVDVEFLVCASQAGGSFQVFDLSVVPAIEVDVTQLPARALTLATP
jgi:hypothetical protein